MFYYFYCALGAARHSQQSHALSLRGSTAIGRQMNGYASTLATQ